MYAPGDPRAVLAAVPASSPPTHFKGAEYVRFFAQAPDEVDGLSRTWYARGQNLVVAYTGAKAGLRLGRALQVDEYVILVPQRETTIEVTAGAETVTVLGYSLVIVPPGPSSVRLLSDGEVVRLITTENVDVAEKSSNQSSYATRDPNVPKLKYWPEPLGGYKIRVYSLDVPDEAGRFGKLFRSTNMMVNYFPASGPRDVTKMSPHHHDDFEQYSLCLDGSFIHYLRWPWTTNLNAWRADEAELCEAPSVAVIPPPAIHTSRGISENNLLVDIFAPPRSDFSAHPGWVLNAADYPIPDEVTQDGTKEDGGI